MFSLSYLGPIFCPTDKPSLVCKSTVGTWINFTIVCSSTPTRYLHWSQDLWLQPFFLFASVKLKNYYIRKFNDYGLIFYYSCCLDLDFGFLVLCNSPNDISYVFSGYAPLSIRLIQHAIRSGWWALYPNAALHVYSCSSNAILQYLALVVLYGMISAWLIWCYEDWVVIT